ncbi:MAG: pseudouridine synthase [Pseudomonadota bacterium]|nr:pseudouridine synthase [Pseudomonadota bacterium]
MSEEKERIAKRLARAGVASRREVERMIADGRVSLNGKRLDTPAVVVGDDDRIEVDGQPVGEPDPPRLWRYHKPAGLVTTANDEKGRATIFDHLPKRLPRVVSIGRLDLNSEGLLLLTNDGGLKRVMELPSTGWLRCYRVRVFGEVTEEGLARLRDGITVDGIRFGPIDAIAERSTGRNSWVEVSLAEGKNREVRRAMEAIGLTVNRLIRTDYGPFSLGRLQPGEAEEVPGFELRAAVRGKYEIRRPASRAHPDQRRSTPPRDQ